jgi:error-prone DNA polymerase
LRLGLPARAAPEGEAAAQVAEVMPKGRNFH